MVIPLIMRGVGMAGRGIGAGIKGVGRAAGNIGGKVQQGWEGAQNFYGGAKSSIQKMPSAVKEQVGGIGRLTGRGFGAARRATGSLRDSARDRAQPGWQGAQNFYGGAKSSIQKMPGAAKVAAGKVVAGAGLMTGVAGGIIGGAAAGGRNVIDAGRRNGAALFVILSILLFLFDVAIGYKGFNIVRIGSIFELLKFISSLGYLIAIWVFLYFFVSKERDVRALASSIIALILVVFSLTLVFKYDPIIIFHLIFILIFWAGFVRRREDATTANIFLIGLLIADLYSFSIISAFSPSVAEILRGFPFLFILTIVFVYEQTGSKIALISILLVLVWYLLTAGPDLAKHFGLVGIEGIKTNIPKDWFELSRKKIVDDPYKKIREGIDAWLSQRIQYAVTGKVEENKLEPLGVYLENVQTADKNYYEDEEVIVWGTVTARTLDDPINIKVGCFVGDDKKIADRTDPDKKFSVFTSEEQDFACAFGSSAVERGILKIGKNTITTFADFNFETLAFLKVYFINIERQRAMVREGQDPFEELAIEDRNPMAVYTNGPANIGMETNNPLVGVSEQYIVQPSLDISISNREGWQGKIKKLKELVIFLPEGIEMTDCSKQFARYDINKCKTDSCGNVKNECLEVCEGYGTGNAYNSCQRECNDNFEKCQRSCDYFFQEGEQRYNGSALESASSQREKDFEGGLSFRCRFRPTGTVLRDSPFTTKTFRVKARYDYTVEKPVSVDIREIPGGTAIPISIPGWGSQGIISCPIENPTISCGSLNSGHSTCQHCSSSYRSRTYYNQLCNAFPRTADGIDVIGHNGLDTYSATLPYIDGQSVQWTYVSAEYCGGSSGTGKTFRATEGTDTYEVYIAHLECDGPGPIGNLFPSGTIAGNLYDGIDGQGRGHTHIQIIKNGNRVNNPEIQLGMCSSAPIVSGGATSGTAREFFNALRASPHFNGFTNNLLWGLTANAFHESGFRADASGDQRGSGNARGIQVGNEYYCSFGYWQLNVCAGGGIGFISHYNLIPATKAEIYAAITNQDKQFEYIAKIMKETYFPGEYSDGSKSARYFGREIAIRFERCGACGESGEQTRLRGNLAASYAGEIVA